MTAPVSLLSWVHNEEKNIEEWLGQIAPYVSEIIIIDAESTDRTAELARKFTQSVLARPLLFCGDMYRMELLVACTQPWILWSYPDERWPEQTLAALSKLCVQGRWNSYAFMRHEYMDGVRIQYEKDGRIIAHGSPASPNYQTRLFQRGAGIFWTELVHAEYHGPVMCCPLPPEYHFEHRKTSLDQEFDNVRTYVWMKGLVWKYGHTQVDPYRRYVCSYRDIIRDSEALNLSGARTLHMSEELWWEWWKYKDEPRISKVEFEGRVGMLYPEFLEKNSLVPRVVGAYANV